jgi:hypothetical protein
VYWWLTHKKQHIAAEHVKNKLHIEILAIYCNEDQFQNFAAIIYVLEAITHSTLHFTSPLPANQLIVMLTLYHLVI